jgi:hypothetical protein
MLIRFESSNRDDLNGAILEVENFGLKIVNKDELLEGEIDGYLPFKIELKYPLPCGLSFFEEGVYCGYIEFTWSSDSDFSFFWEDLGNSVQEFFSSECFVISLDNRYQDGYLSQVLIYFIAAAIRRKMTSFLIFRSDILGEKISVLPHDKEEMVFNELRYLEASNIYSRWRADYKKTPEEF